MHRSHPFVRRLFVVAALSACAIAQAAMSDADRREQNVDSALAKWRAEHPSLASNSGSERRSTLREKTRAAAQKTRETTHRVAEKTRDATHRQAEKVRNFTDEQNRAYDAKKAQQN